MDEQKCQKTFKGVIVMINIEEIHVRLKEQRRERRIAIEELGGGVDNAIRWDNQRPLTTNREQMEKLGVTILPKKSFVTEKDMKDEIDRILLVYDVMGTHFVNTENLSTNRFYELLQSVLDERVTDVPMGDGVEEFIDCSGCEQDDFI
jgi:hypothetical protein